jgi:hypothetical protein
MLQLAQFSVQVSALILPRVNPALTGHLHEVKSAQTSAPKIALARPFIK